MSRVTTIPRPSLQSPVSVQLVDYELHKPDIHRIRRSVFVCEQHIPNTVEADEQDPLSLHVIAHWEGLVVGTGRLTPEGQIGRVAVAKPLRRRGVGRFIMASLLEAAKANGHTQVVLPAQYHAVPFYEKLGFIPEGSPYYYMGIEHIWMRKWLR